MKQGGADPVTISTDIFIYISDQYRPGADAGCKEFLPVFPKLVAGNFVGQVA